MEDYWVQTNGPYGGTISTIEIDPNNPDILYAGGHGGGVYKTTNGGISWVMLEDFLSPSAKINDILISPVDADTLYAYSTHISAHIHKSTDAGLTWVALDNIEHVTTLDMLRNDPDILVAGTYYGRVYRSNDGGINWTEITGDLPLEKTADIAISSAEEYWIGTANGSDGRLFHTANGGLVWNEVILQKSEETDIRSIFVDQGNTDIVYVGLVDVNNEMFDPQNDNFLFKTIDNGDTWITLHPPFSDANMNIIGTFPNDNTLYIGTGGRIYKTTDDGQSWSLIGPPGRNGDMYDIAVDPRDNNVLFVPRDAYGIVKSEDGGNTWAEINEGLLNTSISLLALPDDPASSTVYSSSVWGSGTFKSTDMGETWVNVDGGGITHPWTDELVVSPHDPDKVWQVADVGEVFETTDGGTTWDKIIDTYGDGFRFGSVYTLAPAPSDPDTIYALKNGFGIFKSTDSGVQWRFLHQSEIDYTYSIAVHPTNSDIVYSGYNPKPFQNWAMVRQTLDGGDTWRTALFVPEATAVTSVTIDPNNPDTVYAGSTGESGTIWVSENGGDDWSNINNYFTFTNVHNMTVDPSNPNVAYAGVWGGGTFKTQDGGESWERLLNDPTVSASSILVDPEDSDVVYLADRTSPIIYKTIDNGENWNIYFDAGAGYYRILSAAIASGNPDVIYASIFTMGGPMTGHVYRIENGSGVNVTGSLPRIPVSLTVDPYDENTVYAVLHGYGVFMTTSGGQSWENISGTESGLPQTPHVGFNSLVIDPDNPNVLFLLGGCDVDTDFSRSGADPSIMHTVYKSIDKGATWTNMNDGNLGAASGSIKGLAISPYDTQVLYAGTSNGVYKSTNGGSTWENINSGLNYRHTAGIVISGDGQQIYVPTLGGGVYAANINQDTQQVTWASGSNLSADIYHVQISIDPADSNTLYASSYPGGVFKSVDRGISWAECNFGLASFEIDDPSRQGYYAFSIASSEPNNIYLGLYGVGIYKSTDGAETWQPMNGQQQTMRGSLVTDLIVDTNNSDIIYVSTENGIFHSTDGGLNWNSFSSGLECLDVRTLAMASSGILYAGSRGYELYSNSIQDQMWYQVNAFGNFGTLWPIWNDRPLYQYTSLLFHPTDPDIIYFGTFPSGIYKSTDAGNSWRESNLNWTNDGVFTLVFHPENKNIIYAGTYNGVNLSLDAGTHWKTWDEGWPEEQWVFSIDFDPRNPDIMYACSKNGANEGAGEDDFRGTVMKSINGGKNWFTITNDLDVSQEFYKIITDKYSPETLYLAAQWEGLFISRDGGSSWTSWNTGLTNTVAGTNGNNVTNTFLLSADGLTAYFGTTGSGVFRRQLASPFWDDDNDQLNNYNEYQNNTDPSNPDTDGDGMPDGWEFQYSLNPLIDDASEDNDGDGAENIFEYIRGTNPGDPASYPSRAMPWLPLLLGDE